MKDRSHNRGHVRWRWMAPLLSAAFLLATFCFSGCSDNPADINSTDSETSFFDLPFDELEFAKGGKTYEAVYSAEALISAEDGGIISVGKNQQVFHFEVLPRTIPRDTVVSVTVYVVEDSENSTIIIFEFLPDGLTFATPATLTMDAGELANKAIDEIDWYYLQGNRWIYQNTIGVNTNDKFVIPVEHFSRWGADKGGSA